jgi:hypothetical protein
MKTNGSLLQIGSTHPSQPSGVEDAFQKGS